MTHMYEICCQTLSVLCFSLSDCVFQHIYFETLQEYSRSWDSSVIIVMGCELGGLDIKF
jgi:hypothetical protein